MTKKIETLSNEIKKTKKHLENISSNIKKLQLEKKNLTNNLIDLMNNLIILRTKTKPNRVMSEEQKKKLANGKIKHLESL